MDLICLDALIDYDNFDAIGNKFGMRRIVYVLNLEKSDLVADYRFERTG